MALGLPLHCKKEVGDGGGGANCQDASLRAGAGQDFGRFRERRQEEERGNVRAGSG